MEPSSATHAIALIANGGVSYQPHLVQTIRNLGTGALREVAAGHVGLEILEEPDRPPQEFIPEPEFMGELRAPHLGLGD